MVKIRLKRMGAKKRPVYRIVVADSRSPRDGRFIESIGTYDPMPNPPKTVVDAAKVLEWMGKGARPSDSARFILEREGILPKTPRPAHAAPEAAAVASAPEPAAAVAVAEPEPAAADAADAPAEGDGETGGE